MNWKSIHPDPNDPSVQTALRLHLASRYRGRVADTDDFIASFVRDQRTLDIGIVEHDLRYTETPKWRHNLIRRNARSAMGIDILEDAVRVLAQRGLNVRAVDATSDTDLGERFDRVVCGDVLEHVDNPLRLLAFARRHLAPGGRILCTTPNPFFVPFLFRSLREGRFIANAEHVGWITPTCAMELARRSGLELAELWHTQGEGKTPMRKLAVGALSLLRLRDSELFSGNFYYVFAAAT